MPAIVTYQTNITTKRKLEMFDIYIFQKSDFRVLFQPIQLQKATDTNNTRYNVEIEKVKVTM